MKYLSWLSIAVQTVVFVIILVGAVLVWGAAEESRGQTARAADKASDTVKPVGFVSRQQCLDAIVSERQYTEAAIGSYISMFFWIALLCASGLVAVVTQAIAQYVEQARARATPKR